MLSQKNYLCFLQKGFFSLSLQVLHTGTKNRHVFVKLKIIYIDLILILCENVLGVD